MLGDYFSTDDMAAEVQGLRAELDALREERDLLRTRVADLERDLPAAPVETPAPARAGRTKR